jgi:hypothetical protein
MTIQEILEELPKLTENEKRQLWNVLDQELALEEEEESPEILAALDEGIKSLESGEKAYTIQEVREHIARIIQKARADSRG